MDDGYPSRELVKTFDTEFGRVGLQTCFDMNFMDTWHELYAQHVDIVFWPSAYGGGMPIRGRSGHTDTRGTDCTVPSSHTPACTSQQTTSPFIGRSRSHSSSGAAQEAKRVSQVLSAQ